MNYKDEKGITKIAVLIAVIIIIAILVVGIVMTRSTKNDENFIITYNGTKIYFEENDDYDYDEEASDIDNKSYIKETDTGYITIDIGISEYEVEEYFEYIEDLFTDFIDDEYSDVQISEIETKTISKKDVSYMDIKYNFDSSEHNCSFIVYELEDEQTLFTLRVVSVDTEEYTDEDIEGFLDITTEQIYNEEGTSYIITESGKKISFNINDDYEEELYSNVYDREFYREVGDSDVFIEVYEETYTTLDEYFLETEEWFEDYISEYESYSDAELSDISNIKVNNKEFSMVTITYNTDYSEETEMYIAYEIEEDSLYVVEIEYEGEETWTDEELEELLNITIEDL